MRAFLIKTVSTDPWHNLALEEHLSTLIRPGDVILYLWRNERTVVIGRNQNALRECRCDLLEAEGGYLARRKTGGGAVYQDLGNLCFTFLASPEVYDQKKQFSVIADACAHFGLETRLSGRNDILTADGLKFSGSAFSHTSKCSIHHGTLMLDVCVENMKRYLTPSEEKLKAKGIRSVRSRVRNLRELNPDMTAERVAEALRESFRRVYGLPEEGEGKLQTLSEEALDRAAIGQLSEEYASWDWRYGKSPDCEACFSTRFDWGELEVRFTLHQLRFSQVKIYSDALDVQLPGKLEELFLGERCDQPLRRLESAELTGRQREQAAQAGTWLAGQLGGTERA